MRALTFSCKHGSLVIYSAGCCSGAKLFRFDPSTGQNEDYDLSSYSKSVTCLDDGVGVGWSYLLGMAVAQNLLISTNMCWPQERGGEYRPKGSETETSVVVLILIFKLWEVRQDVKSAGSLGL